MKTIINKIILSDRYLLIIAVASALLAISTFVIFISSVRVKKQNIELRSQLIEMQELKKDLIYIKNIVESQEKKIGLTKLTGVVPTLEDILKGIGLEAKIIKPLDKKKIKEFTEEDAELQIEDIDLNKIVNLLYKIENSPVPLKIKSANIKTVFENPNLFILNMTVSLISK